MIKWRRVKQIYTSILSEVGNIDVVFITSSDWEEYLGDFGDNNLGYTHIKRRIIALAYLNQSEKELKDTIWHEILHIIYPSKPHWWIECCANRMSGVRRLGVYSNFYGHTQKDVPYKKKILRNIHITLKSKKYLFEKKSHKKRWENLKNKPRK